MSGRRVCHCRMVHRGYWDRFAILECASGTASGVSQRSTPGYLLPTLRVEDDGLTRRCGLRWAILARPTRGISDLKFVQRRARIARTAVEVCNDAEDLAMVQSAKFLRRDPADVEPWAETCGQIRCLVEEKGGAAGEVHHVEISDAKMHYHERTDEFYYVIDGQGTMTLDGEEIELHRG